MFSVQKYFSHDAKFFDLLEASADARWGSDPAYLAYKRRTPVLWPWGRRS